MPLVEDTPDHSSLTRMRDRLPLEVHATVFEWALRLVAEKGLLPGKTAAIDSTFLEANAAMKSIVRRDTGEDWNDYHATDTIELADSLNLRTCIPERKPKGKRKWRDVPEEKRRAVLNNRRRVRRAKSKRLQRLRSERVERSFAHVCDTGGTRRSWLHGLEKVQKRYSIAAMARNLGLLMRKVFGIGTPRGLQAARGLALLVWIHIHRLWRRLYPFQSSTCVTEPPCATAA